MRPDPPTIRCENCRFWTHIRPDNYTSTNGRVMWARCNLHSDLAMTGNGGMGLVSIDDKDGDGIDCEVWTAYRFGCTQHEPVVLPERTQESQP